MHPAATVETIVSRRKPRFAGAQRLANGSVYRSITQRPSRMLRPPETFVTARLTARRPRAEDAPAVFAAYANDPDVTRYLSWAPYTRVELLADFLRDRAADWERPTSQHYAWLLCLRGTDSPIGSIGLMPDGGKVMCGYVLAKKFWGRGMMTEALTAVVEWTTAQTDVYRVWAYCDAANPASARVMEKSGLTREALLRRWHVSPNIGTEPRDCIFYAKVK
jgi:RimJ/RimL family protein N-acetyltransferase